MIQSISREILLYFYYSYFIYFLTTGWLSPLPFGDYICLQIKNATIEVVKTELLRLLDLYIREISVE